MSQVENAKALFQVMWDDYCQLNPGARKIAELLRAEGEIVINDHIALRTFAHPKVSMKRLARVFEKLGYEPKQTYEFKEKHLDAQHWEHSDPTLPKVFISELRLHEVSASLLKHIESLIAQIPEGLISTDHFMTSGRSWQLDFSTYQEMATESEYASWVAAHGYRPNHFTVNVGSLKKYPTLQSLNAFLKLNSYRLNTAGGEIKGSPEQLLEQSSTMAESIEVAFSDQVARIPGCYYEFAKRYAGPDGKLYSGFIAASADKIFESTNS